MSYCFYSGVDGAVSQCRWTTDTHEEYPLAS